MKKKFIKGLALTMAMSTLLCNTAFATPIDLRDSVLDVQYDSLNQDTGTTYYTDENNEWANGQISEEVRVTVDLASQFEITIPKEIVLDGETGKADYKVKAVGDIAGDQKLSVIPDPDFVLSEAGGKADVTATVTQPDTEYVYTDLQGDGTEYDGIVQAQLTAGEWSGKFNFNIKFDGGESNTHICNTDGSTSLFTLYEGMDDNLGIPLPLYNLNNGDGTYVTYLRYDITVEEEQTVNINYDVNTTGVFGIFSDLNMPELYLVSPGQTSGNVEINLKEGSNSVYIAMQVTSIDDSFSTSLDSQPCCSICGHIHKYNKEEIIKEAEKFNIGEKKYTCDCGDYFTEEYSVSLNEYSWSEIAAISESGEAQTTLKVGDTKEMTLSNGETYNAEIIGFNHDDLADGSGKVGITFQFKECMNTVYNMNSTLTNVGGWEASEMRIYVNNDIYALLPAELQAEIKTVDKVSDVGNEDASTLVHTSDKLFLLSMDEVGLSDTYNVIGQGKKYEKFTDSISRVKYLSGSATDWWLRSATGTDTTFSFFTVSTIGDNRRLRAYYTFGVAPAFCI